MCIAIILNINLDNFAFVLKILFQDLEKIMAYFVPFLHRENDKFPN